MPNTLNQDLNTCLAIHIYIPEDILYIQGVPKRDKYLRKYKFYRKVFQTTVIWFKNVYLLILSV